jgi:hypothetical protein
MPLEICSSTDSSEVSSLTGIADSSVDISEVSDIPVPWAGEVTAPSDGEVTALVAVMVEVSAESVGPSGEINVCESGNAEDSG